LRQKDFESPALFRCRRGEIPLLLEQIAKQFDHRAQVGASRLAHAHQVAWPDGLSSAPISLSMRFNHAFKCILDVVSGLFPVGECFATGRAIPYAGLRAKAAMKLPVR
jgi:hypothetical protein